MEQLLDARDARAAAHEDDAVDHLLGEVRLGQRVLQHLDGAVEQVLVQVLEEEAGDRVGEVAVLELDQR